MGDLLVNGVGVGTKSGVSSFVVASVRNNAVPPNKLGAMSVDVSSYLKLINFKLIMRCGEAWVVQNMCRTT